MHIPENYLSPETCGVLGVAMVPIWAVAIKKVGKEVPREKMPLLGVAAAFCFLSMMFSRARGLHRANHPSGVLR